MRRNGAAWAWQGAEEKLKTSAERLPLVEGLDLRAYLEKVERTGRFVLTAWKGDKAIRPYAHYSFTTRERAMQWLQTAAEGLALSQMMKAERPKRHEHVADEVREIVKGRYPGLFSVTRGKGTASGWTHIRASDGGLFTPEQNQALKELGEIPGGNFCCMDWRDAGEFVKRNRRENLRVVGAGA